MGSSCSCGVVDYVVVKVVLEKFLLQTVQALLLGAFILLQVFLISQSTTL